MKRSSTLVPRRPVRLGLLAALAGVFVGLTPRAARAEQFVVLDAQFTYTWQDAVAAESRYRVTEDKGLSAERPEDWTSPVDYTDGSVHIRLEVLDQPESTQQVGWALCYVGDDDATGCPYTDYYSTPGLYERDVDMDAFWNHDGIEWDQGIQRIDLVYTINSSGAGQVHHFPGLGNDVTPTTVRLTLVQVSADDTYDPSIIPSPPEPDPGSGEGGAAGHGGDDVTAPPGGAGGAGGDSGAPAPASKSSDGGCSCTWSGASGHSVAWLGLGLVACAIARRRSVA